MSIKEIRKQTNLSQSKFAGMLGIPVRTIQQWEQGKSMPPEYVIQLINDKISNEKETKDNYYISGYKIKNKTKWKECIEQPFKNCCRIHPLQQAKIKSLIESLSSNKDISKIIVFGSSITNRCHIGSDVDIYVEMNKDYNPLPKVYPFEVDFWNNFRTDKRLMDEINKKGVIVYG